MPSPAPARRRVDDNTPDNRIMFQCDAVIRCGWRDQPRIGDKPAIDRPHQMQADLVVSVDLLIRAALFNHKDFFAQMNDVVELIQRQLAKWQKRPIHVFLWRQSYSICP